MSAARAAPNLTVVIPTLGAADEVLESLAALEAATALYPGPVDVIVSDGSDGRDREMEGVARRAGCTYVTGPADVSVQRNRGAARAVTDWVVFIDSDCRADPEFLVALGSHLQDDAVAVAGCVSFEGVRSWIFRGAERLGLTAGFAGLDAADGAAVAWGVTANLTVRIDAFWAVGGFATTFPSHGGEDVDLCWRLRTKGTIRYAAHATVRHPTAPWASVRQMARRLVGYGRADVYLLTEHPEVAGPTGPTLLQGAAIMLAVAMWVAVTGGLRAAGSAMLLWTSTVGTVLLIDAILTKPRDVAGHLAAVLLVPFLDGGRYLQSLRDRRWRPLTHYPLLDPWQIHREWRCLSSSWYAVLAGKAATLVLIWRIG